MSDIFTVYVLYINVIHAHNIVSSSSLQVQQTVKTYTRVYIDEWVIRSVIQIIKPQKQMAFAHITHTHCINHQPHDNTQSKTDKCVCVIESYLNGRFCRSSQNLCVHVLETKSHPSFIYCAVPLHCTWLLSW